MSRFLVYLGRLILIAIAYLLAALAASAAMHLFILPTLGFNRDEAGLVFVGAYMFSIPFIALFVAYFALFPALVVIAIAELWSVRGWLFHALGGGAVGLVLAVMFRTSSAVETIQSGRDIQVIPSGDSILDFNLLAVMIGSGIVGGLAYWLIAGQTSGSWKRTSVGA